MSDVPATPVVWVVGVDAEGVERIRQPLGHGQDPQRVLHGAGLDGTPRTVVGRSVPHELDILFDVWDGVGTLQGGTDPPAADPGLVLAPGEVPTAYQRVAVYVLVRSDRGVLMTQNSDLTNSPGTWVLPGGGIDPGELPEAAAHREVWEETGQQVELAGLVRVTSRHWVGRAPSGRLEDFHAVRIVYVATCAAPSDPVVHDVGGTTAAAGWFETTEVTDLPITSVWRGMVLELIASG